MESSKAERIARLVTERDEMKELIKWHKSKCFVFADIKIERNTPVHSQLLAVFQERLKYVESELKEE